MWGGAVTGRTAYTRRAPMDVLRKAATNGSLLLRTRPPSPVVLFAILAVAPVLVCFRFRVLLPWIRSWYSRSNDSLPCLARAALARPPRAMTTPFTDPRGVMNLRPLCEDVGGMLFDVDNLYLTMVELKRTFLNTPQGVATREILGIHPPLSSLDGRGRPALSQNLKLRRRAPPGVRRGHPAGRPGPTRRLLSALRGVLLPFAHGFLRIASSGSDDVSWKVGRPRALVAS